jgi:hypothetical protein
MLLNITRARIIYILVENLLPKQTTCDLYDIVVQLTYESDGCNIAELDVIRTHSWFRTVLFQI